MRFRQRSFSSSVESLACFDSISIAPIALAEVLSAIMESDLNNAKPEKTIELENLIWKMATHALKTIPRSLFRC